MPPNLFQLLVILSVAILVLTFVRCLLAYDRRGHVTYSFNRDSRLERPPDSPIITEIFYGALDSDSEDFVLKQLLPAYDKAANIMDIILVPIAKTQVITNPNGSYYFQCPQENMDCETNMLHACIVDKVEDVRLQLKWIECMWRHGLKQTPLEAFVKCSPSHRLTETTAIKECVKSDRGMDLLKLNSEQAKAAGKGSVNVPFVILNGLLKFEAKRIGNLLEMICELSDDTKITRTICEK